MMTADGDKSPTTPIAGGMADSGQRVLWACRHGERIDMVDTTWHQTARAYDDPHLSDRGVIQATETGQRLKNEHIDFVFSSPFERCVHTAQIIVNARDTPLPIFLEQGITEALMFCQDPPGCLSTQELKAKFPSVDENYEPICKELPPESPTDMLACLPRIRDTLMNMVRKYKGNILIVSHAASIAASHGIFAEKRVWANPGLCSLSKFVQVSIGSFTCELNCDTSHLSDQSNLKPF